MEPMLCYFCPSLAIQPHSRPLHHRLPDKDADLLLYRCQSQEVSLRRVDSQSEGDDALVSAPQTVIGQQVRNPTPCLTETDNSNPHFSPPGSLYARSSASEFSIRRESSSIVPSPACGNGFPTLSTPRPSNHRCRKHLSPYHHSCQQVHIRVFASTILLLPSSHRELCSRHLP